MKVTIRLTAITTYILKAKKISFGFEWSEKEGSPPPNEIHPWLSDYNNVNKQCSL
jgi:hypothetical protein